MREQFPPPNTNRPNMLCSFEQQENDHTKFQVKCIYALLVVERTTQICKLIARIKTIRMFSHTR